MAVQTALDRALVQWPFLHDTSLVAATAAVFVPTASHSLSHDAARSAAQAAAAGALDVTLLQPWLYNNVLLLNSQLFIPVLDKVRPVFLRLCTQSPAISPGWSDRCMHSQEKEAAVDTFSTAG